MTLFNIIEKKTKKLCWRTPLVLILSEKEYQKWAQRAKNPYRGNFMKIEIDLWKNMNALYEKNKKKSKISAVAPFSLKLSEKRTPKMGSACEKTLIYRVSWKSNSICGRKKIPCHKSMAFLAKTWQAKKTH